MRLRRREGRLFGRRWEMHHRTRWVLYNNWHMSRTRGFYHAGIHPTYRAETARSLLAAVRFEYALLISSDPLALPLSQNWESSL